MGEAFRIGAALGALIAGVAYVPASPPYSLVSQDYDKLHHIMRLCTPGLVFASDARYAKAIAATVPADCEVVLCEGGPTLNAQLLAEDLVDEWCQTVAPLLASGSELRGTQSASPGVVRRLRLARAIAGADGELLLRYTRG